MKIVCGLSGLTKMANCLVGIPPPTPTWGNMLADSLNAGLVPPWWLVLFPGLAITLTVLAFNLLGDGIRDVLDPRLRQAL